MRNDGGAPERKGVKEWFAVGLHLSITERAPSLISATVSSHPVLLLFLLPLSRTFLYSFIHCMISCCFTFVLIPFTAITLSASLSGLLYVPLSNLSSSSLFLAHISAASWLFLHVYDAQICCSVIPVLPVRVSVLCVQLRGSSLTRGRYFEPVKVL